MNKLKQILLQRIRNILDLQQVFKNAGANSSTCSDKDGDRQKLDQIQQRKRELIAQHRNAEKYRSVKENQLLINLNAVQRDMEKLKGIKAYYFQLYQHSVQIFAAFNNQYIKYKDVHPTHLELEHQCIGQSIRKLYCQFFDENGFKNKSEYISNSFNRHSSTESHGHSHSHTRSCPTSIYNPISPTLYLGWLSQWSKKIYCQLLQNQLQKVSNLSYSQKEKNFRQTGNQNTSAPVTMVMDNKKKLNNISHNSVTSNTNICKNINNQEETNETTYELSFMNKASVHSFFVDDLQQYYKICGFQGIDFSYLKSLRKRFRKEQFLKSSNLNKAVDTLIQTTNNKDIRIIMKGYYIQYFNKFPKRVSNHSNQRPYTKAPENIKKLTSLQPIKRIIRTNTQSDESPKKIANFNTCKDKEKERVNKSKLMSAKLSQFQFMKPEQIELKIKKLKIINQRSVRNNIEFPGVSGLDMSRRQILSKNQLKQLISHKYMVAPATSFGRKLQAPASVQKRLRNQQFLRCQSIQVKYKFNEDVQALQDYLIKSNFQSTTNNINITSNLKNCKSFQFNGEYDDQKIKIAKKFQISELRKNFKLVISKKSDLEEVIS